MRGSKDGRGAKCPGVRMAGVPNARALGMQGRHLPQGGVVDNLHSAN